MDDVPNSRAIYRLNIISPISVLLKLFVILLSIVPEYFILNYIVNVIIFNIVLFVDPTQLSPELRPSSHHPKGIHNILIIHMMGPAGHPRVPITFACYFSMKNLALQIEALFKNQITGGGTLIFIIR